MVAGNAEKLGKQIIPFIGSGFQEMLRVEKEGADRPILAKAFIHATSAAGGTIISFDADGTGPSAAVEVAKLEGVTHVDIQTLLAQGQILV